VNGAELERRRRAESATVEECEGIEEREREGRKRGRGGEQWSAGRKKKVEESDTQTVERWWLACGGMFVT
jgi:hypothetical protein